MSTMRKDNFIACEFSDIEDAAIKNKILALDALECTGNFRSFVEVK